MQFAYRAQYSASDALATIADVVARSHNVINWVTLPKPDGGPKRHPRAGRVAALLIDLSAAFDRLPHHDAIRSLRRNTGSDRYVLFAG